MNGIRKLKHIALDSNLFIYHFENNRQFSPYTQAIFERLLQNKLKAVTSIISLIESLSYPSPRTVLQKIEESFTTIPNFVMLEVNQAIAVEAARIRRTYEYRLPDAVQLATALHAKAQAFVSNDKRLKRCKEIPVILLKEIKI